jgi:hypothetical protein
MILSLLKDVDYFYEPVNHLYNTKDVCFVHKKDNTFSLHKAEHGFPNASFIQVHSTHSAEEFLDECKSRHLNLLQIESIASKCLLDEAVHAKIRTNTALKYFSEEDIDKHLAAWKEFTKILVANIEKHEYTQK